MRTFFSVGCVLLVPFTLIVLRHALALHAASPMPFCAIKFDCGCGAGEIYICRKLAENSVLTLLSLGLILTRARPSCLRHSLSNRLPGGA